MKILVTGSSGLIGSEAVERLDRDGHEVYGIDNNLRRQFFGPAGDTLWNLDRLRTVTRRFTHHNLDIRDRAAILDLFSRARFDLIIHCAAQPSHDKAREIPFVDFDVNAVGTLNLLEATRQHCKDAVFVHMSTNKVYGAVPNELPLDRTPDAVGLRAARGLQRHRRDLPNRSHAPHPVRRRQDGGRHPRAGVRPVLRHERRRLSRRLPDGRTPQWRAASRLSLLPRQGRRERIGLHDLRLRRQTGARSDPQRRRDCRHLAFAREPRPGEVYNLGGGRENSASILECISLIEALERDSGEDDVFRPGARGRSHLLHQRHDEVQA